MVDYSMAGKYCTCIAIDFDIFFGLYKHLALKVAITVYFPLETCDTYSFTEQVYINL